MTVETFISEDEYLIREPEAAYKSEFRNGRVVAMTGASPAHSLITGNVFSEIHYQLKNRPCRVFTSDTRIKVERAHLYTYPDLSVVCEEPRFDRRDRHALINPTLIVEVLSPSTEAYDRGQKFCWYRQLSSLREYVLVAQDSVCVERFSKGEDGEWTSTRVEDMADAIDLPAIGCRLHLADVYAKTR